MDPAVEAPVVVSQQRRTANTTTTSNNTMKNTTNRMSMKNPRGVGSKQQQAHSHFDRSMSENVNRYVRKTSGGGVHANVNTNLHDMSSSSLSTTTGGTPVPPTSVPSSSVHIDLYLVNIFKWRVRQDTFIKLVLIL